MADLRNYELSAKPKVAEKTGIRDRKEPVIPHHVGKVILLSGLPCSLAVHLASQSLPSLKIERHEGRRSRACFPQMCPLFQMSHAFPRSKTPRPEANCV